ncbi:MAG: phosphatidyl-myo-inositol dimannoside synthase [Acidobacteriota bacterium]|nr:phosphatidyl-myo-inositol dimannoside synthase [Acidobacteriota bacterium]
MTTGSNSSDSESKGRILLVLPEVFNCEGGIQMFCRALCLASGKWAQRNHTTVHALVLNDHGRPDALYVNGGYSSYVGANKNKGRFIQHYLRRTLTSNYEWIIFAHVSLSPLALLTKSLKAGIKIGVVAHGVEVWHPLPNVQRRALHAVDLILAVSEYTKGELIKLNAVPADKIKIFPNTLDPHWTYSSSTTELVCAPPVLLSVSRMNKEDRYKGIDSVIRSLPAVVEQIGPIRYNVVGQGDDVPRLKALAAGLGVSRYVKFLGGVEDGELRKQYQHCSLFIMPSKKEGFGIVFLEAMAYGKPVIGGAHGGTPSVVKHGETGWLNDNSDIEGIANSIIQLLGDEAMRENFGRAGHQRLIDNFTFERFEQNLKAVFSSLN